MRYSHVILSSPLLLEDGVFEMKTLSLEEARRWVRENSPFVATGHETVKAVGLSPNPERVSVEGFDEALCLKPLGRLEFGREYSFQEILDIGVRAQLIKKIS